MDWQKKYRDKIVSAKEAVSRVQSGDHIAVSQLHGASRLLMDALYDRRMELYDVCVLSGISIKSESIILENYEPHIYHVSRFSSQQFRSYYHSGRGQFFPLHLSLNREWMSCVFKPTVAFVMVTEPDNNGLCSLSMNADSIYDAVELSRCVIAHVNPLLPRTDGAQISLDEVTCVVYEAEPLGELHYESVSSVERCIARHIANRITDGACLQLGIGSLPDSIMSLLHDRNNLGIHTECFSDAVAEMTQKGIITNEKKQIDKGKSVATFVAGTAKLIQFLSNNKGVMIMPPSYTNNPYIISQNDNVVSINSCLEVDLLGQVNAECINGLQYSGVGGQVDFIRGASMSKGGQSFIVMPSTAINGTVSRVVASFVPGTAVTTSRCDVKSIVTEYGIADLWGKNVRQRAQELIKIAHPKYRESLERQAYELHYLR